LRVRAVASWSAVVLEMVARSCVRVGPQRSCAHWVVGKVLLVRR